LNADYTLRECEHSIDSFAGSERATIKRTDDGYAIEAEGLDGWRVHQTLVTEPLLPSERLTATLWPLVVRRNEITKVLDLDESGLAVRDALLEHGKLKVTRPTHVTEQRYSFGADGKFGGMQETMPLLWLRELVPA
jgi:hypothetical protein